MVSVDGVSSPVVDDPCLPDDLSSSPLPLGPAGDVAAARSVARRLLFDRGWGDSPALTLATLLVTALCLHAGVDAADGVALEDVTDLLRRMLDGDLFAELRGSPMQFVGYASAELQALGVLEGRKLLQALLSSLEGHDAQSKRWGNSGDLVAR